MYVVPWVQVKTTHGTIQECMRSHPNFRNNEFDFLVSSESDFRQENRIYFLSNYRKIESKACTEILNNVGSNSIIKAFSDVCTLLYVLQYYSMAM